ncbi:hypothetical protein EMIT0P44_80146 [Pseudomonas sp. IT-P44]
MHLTNRGDSIASKPAPTGGCYGIGQVRVGIKGGYLLLIMEPFKRWRRPLPCYGTRPRG